jgi:orotidine-5'-phosphate decarboxylase
MLVAYLRGLLKPTLPNRLQSSVRETLILKALGKEMDADILSKTMNLEASLVKQPDRNFQQTIQRQLLQYAQLRELRSDKQANADIYQNAREKFVQMYKLLQYKGILKKVEETQECKQVIIRH